MSTAMTAAGESLVARLQAEGKPLIIDRMIFAHLPGHDHTAPIAPGAGIPAKPNGQVVHEYNIPREYRAFVNPNQVVYSAMLGSDVGDFTFNWQGLYCTEYATLVAVATFPALEKRRYDVATGKSGNNLTRNFLITFTGAREITGITISADVWQLDFTVRLKGMDERERLSNFDLYGQGYFEGDGWLLTKNNGAYTFSPGLGYVAGIRALLPEVLPLAVNALPRDVWLDVCLKPVGSDRVAEATALLVHVAATMPDAPDETGLMHYHQLVARINANGTVTDLRPKTMAGLPPSKIGAVPATRKITVTAPLTGGGDLSTDRSIGISATAAATANNVILRDANGRAQVAAPAAAADIARKADVDTVAAVANAAAPAARTITVSAPLTGGGNLSANRSIGINASSAATANFVIQRDAAGRAQVAAPSAAADIARKADVDAVAARTITTTAPLTGGGNLSANRTIGINASSAATANFVIQRDAAGRAQVAAPSAAADIARKADVDAARDAVIPKDPVYLTTSGTWTAPESRYYHVTLVGGGGGGAGGYGSASFVTGGSGGGAGHVVNFVAWFSKGQRGPYTIGAGGAGGGCNLSGAKSGDGAGGGTTVFGSSSAQGGTGATGSRVFVVGGPGNGECRGCYGVYGNSPDTSLTYVGGFGGNGYTSTYYGMGGDGGTGCKTLAGLTNGLRGNQGVVVIR